MNKRQRIHNAAEDAMKTQRRKRSTQQRVIIAIDVMHNALDAMQRSWDARPDEWDADLYSAMDILRSAIRHASEGVEY